EAGEDVKTGELLRAYLPVEGMFKIVNEDGESTRTITDPELQHLKDFKTKYYDSEKYTTIKIGKDSYIFVSVPIITEKEEVANLQLMESLESTSHIFNILRDILIIVTSLAMISLFLYVHMLSKIISKPILSMIVTMSDNKKSGEYKRITLQEQVTDELYKIETTLNALIEQLEKNYEHQVQSI